MQPLPLKLDAGSDLRVSIEGIGRDQNKSGFILGVVGNLSRACFQCPGQPKPTVLEGNLEIITLNGTFSPTGVHLHLSISDSDCQVWGGHLEQGSKLLKGADVLLAVLDDKHQLTNSSRQSDQIISPRISISVISGCPWCSRALRILSSLQIKHNVQLIEDDESFQLLKERTGMTTFPQVFIDGQLLGGYDSLEKLKASGKLIEFQ